MGFAQRIDGRVGDLREALLAVIPQGSGERGKKGGRSVVAHAPVGFFAMDESGKKNFELVFCPAGGAGDALGVMDGDCRGDSGRAQHSLRNGVAGLLDGEALEDVAPT